MRTAVLAGCGVAAYFYTVHVYMLPKTEYNVVHPYTSWIPITLWIIVRNITPTLRLHHLRLYGWLGCITLETYICQFHVWMKTEVPDGQPKKLLVLLPDYPMLNFALVTALYGRSVADESCGRLQQRCHAWCCASFAPEGLRLTHTNSPGPLCCSPVQEANLASGCV